MQPVRKLPADPYQAWFNKNACWCKSTQEHEVSELAGLSVIYRKPYFISMVVCGVREKIIAKVTHVKVLIMRGLPIGTVRHSVGSHLTMRGRSQQ